jgi:squalene synthase HpnC
MTIDATTAKSGKDHGDENFPVASRLIHPRHRGQILAFYRFVRAADDVADHTSLSPDAKVALLDGLEASLLGRGPHDPEAEPLRRALAERGLEPTHAQHLLDAFRLDARKSRTRDWADLMHYCSLSAMPVGRFVLDVHGEDRSTWTASDALCAALQVINHLQDCGEDYRDLDRVYLPENELASAGATVADFGRSAGSPALLGVIHSLAERTGALLAKSRPLAGQIRDRRLAMEVGVIQSLAEGLTGKLRRLDPLRDRTQATKAEALLWAGRGALRGALARRPPPPAKTVGAAA